MNPSRRNTLIYITLFCMFVLTSLLAIIFNAHITAGIAGDAASFHVPQIAAMKSPDFSLRDGPYYTAMIPFFHYLAAGLIPEDLLPPDAGLDFPLLGLAVLIGAVCFAIAHLLSQEKAAQGRSKPWHDALVVACLLFSYYVFLPVAVYNTDALAFVMLMASFWAYYRQSHLAAGTALILAVLFKTIYLGALAFPFLLALNRIVRDRRIGSESLMLASTALPALLCIAALYLYWDGLIPPGLGRELNRGGFHAHGLLHFLGYFAFTSVFFLSFRFWLDFRMLSAPRERIILAALLVLITVIWYITPNGMSVKDGRFGSVVWKAAGLWQSGDRSFIVLLLSLLGGMMLFKLGRVLREDTFAFSVFLVMCVYCCSLSFTHAAYQRYVEPFTLLCLVYLYFLSRDFADRTSSIPMKGLFLVYNAGVIARAFLL